MLHVEGTLHALQWLGSGTHWALRQLRLGRAGDSLEVVVAGVAEMGGPEAEVDSHRTAVATLVLQEVGPVLRAHLDTHTHTHTRARLPIL